MIQTATPQTPRPAPAMSDPRLDRGPARRRAIATVVGACAFSLVATGLVVTSFGLATGAILVAAARGIQQHALAAPALNPPPTTLNLEPIAVDGMLPNHLPGVGSATRDRDPPTDHEPLLPHAAASDLLVAPASTDPLAGPRIAAEIRTTLVARDIEGTLVSPDPNPGEAALRLISLDEGSRRAINAALNIRGQHLDHAVIINLPFIIVAQSGQAGGNKPLVLGAAAVALARSREFLALEDLESLIASQLPAPQRAHYRALLQDYWHQFALDAARARAAKAQDPAPESLLIAEGKLKLLGEEIARSFDRVVRSGDLMHYWFSRHVGLTPDQAARFRATLATYAQTYGADGDSSAKRALLDDLRAGLTRTQQRTLERNMKGFLD